MGARSSRRDAGGPLAPPDLPLFAGVPHGQRASEGPVLEAGHLLGPAGQNLDMFRAHPHPLHRADEGPAPGPAVAVQRLHHVQGESAALKVSGAAGLMSCHSLIEQM